MIGIGGSLVGGLIGNVIWRSPDAGFRTAGWLMSIGGALVVLCGYLPLVNDGAGAGRPGPCAARR